MCIKSEIEEILFKHATNDHSDEAFQLTLKFWPCPRAMFYFFSSITTDFNISLALRWAIQDQIVIGLISFLLDRKSKNKV